MSHDCDCGRPKEPAAEGCRRCVWLDGDNRGRAGVVWALRQIEPATSEAIADAVGQSKRNVLRNLHSLMASGRVEVISEQDLLAANKRAVCSVNSDHRGYRGRDCLLDAASVLAAEEGRPLYRLSHDYLGRYAMAVKNSNVMKAKWPDSKWVKIGAERVLMGSGLNVRAAANNNTVGEKE